MHACGSASVVVIIPQHHHSSNLRLSLWAAQIRVSQCLSGVAETSEVWSVPTPVPSRCISMSEDSHSERKGSGSLFPTLSLPVMASPPYHFNHPHHSSFAATPSTSYRTPSVHSMSRRHLSTTVPAELPPSARLTRGRWASSRPCVLNATRNTLTYSGSDDYADDGCGSLPSLSFLRLFSVCTQPPSVTAFRVASFSWRRLTVRVSRVRPVQFSRRWALSLSSAAACLCIPSRHSLQRIGRANAHTTPHRCREYVDIAHSPTVLACPLMAHACLCWQKSPYHPQLLACHSTSGLRLLCIEMSWS